MLTDRPEPLLTVQAEHRAHAVIDTVIADLKTQRSWPISPHDQAVSEFRSAGPAGRDLAPTFGRLLALKRKSQYQAASVMETDAGKAVAWAERMVEAAAEVVAGCWRA